MTKYLILMQGSLGRIQGVNFFSRWHPCEPRFKSGFHNSFWDLVVSDRISWMILEIYKWNLGTSFGSFSGIHVSKIICSVVCWRVPQCLSPRPNWDPHPLSRKECVPPWNQSGGRLACGWGGGGANCARLEKKPSTLSTLWYNHSRVHSIAKPLIRWSTALLTTHFSTDNRSMVYPALCTVLHIPTYCRS